MAGKAILQATKSIVNLLPKATVKQIITMSKEFCNNQDDSLADPFFRAILIKGGTDPDHVAAGSPFKI